MTESTRRGSRVAVGAARLLAVLALVAATAAVALPLLGGGGYLDDLMRTPEVTIGVAFSVVGALIVGRRQAGAVGWLLLGPGVCSAVFALSTSVVSQALVEGLDTATHWPLTLALWLTTWTWLPAYLMILTIIPHLLPDGRPVSRGWAVPLALATVVMCVQMVNLAVQPGQHAMFPTLDNPLAHEGLHALLSPRVGPLDPDPSWGLPLLAGLSLASLVVRVVRADPGVRRQIGWVAYSTGAAVVVVVASELGAPQAAVHLAVALIPAGIGIAVLRYRLYDLDLVVNRTIVAGVVVAGSAVVYATAVGWISSLLRTEGTVSSFLAAFVVALLFHPARVLVQRHVDRLFFGRRGDPLALLNDVDRAMQEAGTPRQALEAAVTVVRDGLLLSGVEARVPMPSGDVVRAVAGEPDETTVAYPLQLHGHRVGELVIGARPRDNSLTSGDARLLPTLAGMLGSVAYALRLSEDLEQSRARLIEAREQERRRLRRDLHDGLGPQLAGVVMGLDSIRVAMGRGDEGRATQLAHDVAERARAAVDDVRRLVVGLRPPVLDDLGLVGALMSTVPSAGAGAPEVRVAAEGDVSPLPAAVEVAAYRIASEAIVNACRHSGARGIDVLLERRPDALEVSVTDDGCGLPDPVTPGVGLLSMRERAAELGGWCRLAPAEPRGTRVVAHLPLGSAR